MGAPPDASQADALKQEGNDFYKNGEYLKAAAAYTKAIKLDSKNEVLYSNRSEAFLRLSKIKQALADAETVISLRPTWEKGFYRKGLALDALERYDEALAAYRDAAELNPKMPDIAHRIKHATKQSTKARQAKGAAPSDDGNAFVRSDEDYETLKASIALGAEIPYTAERAEAFGKRILNEAVNAWVAADGEIEPVCHFLGGCLDESGTEETHGQVKMTGAFDSSPNLEQCAGFLQQYAADLKAHAACAVVPRSCLEFPQPWTKGRGKRGWQFGAKPGFFVQLEAPKKLRRLWFVPCDREKGVLVPQTEAALDVEVFMLLPPLF